MISRTARWSFQAAVIFFCRPLPMPGTSVSRSGSFSMTSKTAVPKVVDHLLGELGADALDEARLARYFCIPSTVLGWAVLSTWALNCWPCVGSTAQRPWASTHSPARTSGRVPTTVTRSRLALDLHLQHGEAGSRGCGR